MPLRFCSVFRGRNSLGNETSPNKAVILSQCAHWRENPPDVQSAITGPQSRKHQSETQHLKSSRRARLPRRAARGKPKIRTFPCESAQAVGGNVGKLLVSFRQQTPTNYQKIQCEYVISSGFARKCTNLKDFTAERSPFPTFPLINCTDSPNLVHHRKLIPARRRRVAPPDEREVVWWFCIWGYSVEGWRFGALKPWGILTPLRHSAYRAQPP